MCHTVYYILFQSTLLQEERPTVCINFSCSKSYFNPRSYKRSDEGSDKVNLLTQIFQSTLLQEERLNALNSGIYSNNFNPRSYKRSDVYVVAVFDWWFLFQSTLLQEERQQKCTIILILICNNYCIVSIKSHQHYNNYFM